MAILTAKATLAQAHPKSPRRQPGGPIRYIAPAFILIAIFFIAPVAMLLLRLAMQFLPPELHGALRAQVEQRAARRAP